MADQRQKASSTSVLFQRATVACQSCRLRKVKCDAQTASSDEGCTPCRRAGQECLLDPLSDKRRSVSRKFVDKLQQRIETLEALNQRAVGRPAWRSEEEDASPPADAPVVSGGSNIAPPMNRTGASPPQRKENTDLGLGELSRQAPPSSTLINGSSPPNARHESPTFYGATSHPHVASPGEEPRPTLLDDVDVVGIDLDPLSPRLRSHLFHAFFKYQKLWVDIVNKESFLTHQANGVNSQWYSELLENVMLACGARLSTSKSVRALGSKYLEWAKEDVLKAMSEPTPANLQGFLLLSEYEVTQGNDRPGWMFCGVACRMLSDLGLHELASNISTPKEAQEPTKESDLAYALLSACVVYEGVWTLYLGRPSSIPRSTMNVASSRCKARRKTDSPWLNAWVGLCVPMAEISHVINEQSTDGSDRSASLQKLLRQMEEWHENLPPELRYNESSLTNMEPAGYGLHTQYCKVQILLRRALDRSENMRKRRHSQISSNSSSSHRLPLDDSNAITYQYALRIARLVVTYRETFGMEKIPSIMLDNGVVAATTMMNHLSIASNANEVQQQSMWLRQLIKSMESLQPHFPITGRMLDYLRQIRENGASSDTLPAARRDVVDAPNEIPTLNGTLNLSSGSNDTQNNSITIGSNMDLNWDSFDMDIDLGAFVGDTALDLPPPETLIPGMAQAVP